MLCSTTSNNIPFAVQHLVVARMFGWVCVGVLLLTLCCALSCYLCSQAQVNDRDMVGVVEKSDLLRLAKSRTQLWECRRLSLCGSHMTNNSSAAGEVSLLQLQAAMAVFRVECPAGGDAVAAVRGVKDTLKRTYNK
jgi:hypothetical protein